METETLKHRDVEGPRHTEVRPAGVQPGGYEILEHYKRRWGASKYTRKSLAGPRVSVAYELTIH